MKPLDWTDHSTVEGTTLDCAILREGAIWMVSGTDVQGYRLRFAPNYPAGIGSPAEAKAVLANLSEDSGTWHQVKALVDPLGIAVGAVVSRYLGFQLIEASRSDPGEDAGDRGYKKRIEGPREILTQRGDYGTLSVEIDDDGFRVAFVRSRTKMRKSIATLCRTGTTISGERYLRPLPLGWGDHDTLRRMALYCGNWAQRAGHTGPAYLTVPSKRHPR